MNQCYNCGVELNDQNRTREHIPAQNTFAGYPNEYKVNRLTVPACFECNNKYSKTDQEIRDAIGIMNDDNALQQELSRKAVASIMRNHNWPERIEWKNGKVGGVLFNYNTFRELHIKNFKGVFYQKYGFPIPEEYEIQIIAEGDYDDLKLNNIAKFLTDYVYDGGDIKFSGHPDIFQYKTKTITPMEDGLTINDSPTLDNALGIVGVLDYHKNIKAVIIAAKKDYLQSIYKKNGLNK
jgi:hypothetical protein